MKIIVGMVVYASAAIRSEMKSTHGTAVRVCVATLYEMKYTIGMAPSKMIAHAPVVAPTIVGKN